MPAVQCLRGMNSPANGIFFPRPASLTGGMTRQAAQGGRLRARPPPVLPKGGTRRGGSKIRERCKRATGRSPLKTGSEQADGRSSRGSGSVFGKRQDVMCRRAAAERIERRPLRRVDSACLRRPACGSRAFPGVQDNYREGAAPCRTHQGGSVRESPGITIACARIRAAPGHRSGSVIALDNCRYRA